MSERPLTARQQRFVAEYLISGNGTQAAIKAGYSAHTANVTAAQTLAKPYIQAALAVKQAKVFKKLELTHERVTNEIARLAFFDPRDLFHPDGTPKQINELSDDTAACISGLEVVEMYAGTGPNQVITGAIKKYKIADKNSALEKAAKILGLFEKDNSQNGGALADVIKGFLGQLHSNGGSRLPLAPPQT